jgi:hypothetical protein
VIARAGLGGLVLAAVAFSVAADDGGVIRGGEHADFSRVVLTVSPTTEWVLETGQNQIAVRFPDRQIDFDASGVFAKMPRTRVLAVRTVAASTGTEIVIELACACGVSTAFVGGRYLAVDVTDRTGSETATASLDAAQNERDESAVATAEMLLIRQIERAAGQGLVDVSKDDSIVNPSRSSPAEETAPAHSSATERIRLLDYGEQVDAVTVFDRDGAAGRVRADLPAAACVKDERLDIASWSNGMAFPRQVAALRHSLVGEFDRPDPDAVAALARFYIHFGFGAEAEALIRAFDDAAVEDGSLLIDLARVVDGLPAAAAGPLSYAGPCPGSHGLWLALGGRAPVYRDRSHFAAVQATFEDLPVSLRRLVGPGFAERLRVGGRPEEARTILDVVVRNGDDPTDRVRLEAAFLAVDDGDLDGAARSFAGLAGRGHDRSPEALEALARLALRAHATIPDRIVLDLRSAALQHRGTPRELGFRRLVVEALAARGELSAALEETRAAMRALPDDSAPVAAAFLARLGSADPDEVGAAVFAETALAAADLLSAQPARAAARRSIARTLIGLGLPNSALSAIAPALVTDDPAARLIAAEAELDRMAPQAARGVLGALEGTTAAKLRAESFALEGRYALAASALAAAGLADQAAAYAWASGDWARVATADPERSAMARYMAARADPSRAPPPASDLSALEPGAAFQQPVPDIGRASLAAARRLTAAGPGIAGLVRTAVPETEGAD